MEMDTNNMLAAALAATSIIELIVIKTMLTKALAQNPDVKPQHARVTRLCLTIFATLVLLAAIGIYVFRPF